MRRFTFLTLLLLAVAAPAGLAVAGERGRPYIVVFGDAAVTRSVAESGNYFVRTLAPPLTPATKTKRQVDETRVRKHISEIRARIGVDVDNIYASALGGFSANLTSGQLHVLERDPAVAAIVPDEEVTIDDGASRVNEAGGIRTTASPRSNVPAGIRRVGAERNKIARVDGHDNRVNADVAVIDTGIERDHPDLNVVGGYNCTSRNRDKWDDVDGHGTHVAGIIGAKDNHFGVVGVAPGVRLWSVKVLGPRGSGRISWLVCGIDWVTSQREKGNQSRPMFEVANMSLSFSLPRDLNGDCGGDLHDSVHQAICRSVAKGTVYVIAAGNESRNARQNRPAAYDEVITVSALADYDGQGGGRGATNSCPYWTPERDDAFTTFSNFGPDIDLIAPGRCILSTYPRKRYAWMSGTSMASPHVAGAAAVYLAMYPRATPPQVRMALQAVGTRDWRTGTDHDQTHEKAVWIGNFRTMPDFSAAASVGNGRVAAGSSIRVSVDVTRIGGFDDPVSVSLSGPPKGISALKVRTSAARVTFRVRVGSGVPAGHYPLTVTATSADIERTTTVTIHVTSAGPRASFSSPPAGTTLTSASTLKVSWNQAPSDGQVLTGRLTRQSAPIRNAGECDNLDYRDDRTQMTGSPVNAKLASGFCYRWLLTLRDGDGKSSIVVSGQVLVDADPPTAVTWVSALTGTAVRTRNIEVTLDWRGGSDDESGLARSHRVMRYVAPLSSSAECRDNSFQLDVAPTLRRDGARDSGLVANRCYVWGVRTLDYAGNSAAVVWSGYVIVERDKR